jgi:hypothetical protein
MLLLDLEPQASRELKSGLDTSWTTIAGKKNRIAVGNPFCSLEVAADEKGLLTPADLAAFSIDNHDFYRITFSLTLLPDANCRFESVDFIANLVCDQSNGVPLFRRLRPIRQESKIAIKETTSEGGKISAGPILKMVNAEVSDSRQTDQEYEKYEVSVESFGPDTRSAGWRFRLLSSREIPLATTDLEALVVTPKGGGKITFSVAARIAISGLDGVLSSLFLRNHAPDAATDYQFP